MKKIGVMVTIITFGLFMFAGSAMALPWFLGIGNDGYITDVNGLWGAMSLWDNWQVPGDHVRIQEDRDGSQIEDDLLWLAGNVQPGDVAVFYYSGHGGTFHSDTNGDETAAGNFASNSNDESIGLLGSPSITDDQIAAILGQIPESVTTITIFDSCHAGGMVGGTTDLNSVDDIAVLMSSAEDETSFGHLPSYSEFTAPLIAGISGSNPADLDDDGLIYADEWFSYAASYTTGQTPQFFSNLDDVHNRPIFGNVIPEPTSIILLGIGLVGVGMAVRRKRTLK